MSDKDERIALHGWKDLIIDSSVFLMLTSREYKLYSYYILRGRNKGWVFPGLARIASDLTLIEEETWSVATVKRTNAGLIKKKLIYRQRRMSSSSITHVFKHPAQCEAFINRLTHELTVRLTHEPSNSAPMSQVTDHPRADIKRTKIKENKEEDAARKRDPLFDAIVEVCKLNPKISGSYIGKTRKALSDMGKTPDDIQRFGVWWYANDWRGKQGQAPTQNQLVTEVEKAILAPSNGHHPDKSKGDGINHELAAYLKARKAQEKSNADQS